VTHRSVVLYLSTDPAKLRDFVDRYGGREYPVKDQKGNVVGTVRNLKVGTKVPGILGDVDMDPVVFQKVANAKMQTRHVPVIWDRVYSVFVP